MRDASRVVNLCPSISSLKRHGKPPCPVAIPISATMPVRSHRPGRFPPPVVSVPEMHKVQVFHRFRSRHCRNRASAACATCSTCSPSIGASPSGPGATTARAHGPQGAYSEARLRPNRPSVGIPLAAARCMRPESLPINSVHCPISAATCVTDSVPPVSSASGNCARTGRGGAPRAPPPPRAAPPPPAPPAGRRRPGAGAPARPPRGLSARHWRSKP